MRHLYMLLLLFGSCTAGQDELRVSCAPEGAVTTSECKARGCQWSPVSDPDAPWCYFPSDWGYIVTSTEHQIRTTVVRLERHPSYSNLTLFGDDFSSLVLTITEESDTRLRVRLEPESEQRFEVPIEIFPPEDGYTERLYKVEITETPIFSLKIIRKSTNQAIFDTNLPGLIFSEQFVQLPIRLPSTNLYGIGENEQHGFRHNFTTWKIWSLYARDQPPAGEPIYRFNMYGVHPRYTLVEDDGSTHSVIFINSNAQEFETFPLPGLVYRTIGGLLDILVLLGPSPEDVAKQASAALGRFYIPPYWALGYHLCRWGYNSLENMQAAFQRTVDLGIPLDAQWGDIDIMERSLDFTVDPDNFAGLPAFVRDIQALGHKFVTILDPGLSTGEPSGNYPSFEAGQENEVWIVGEDEKPVTGKVWPEHPVYFVDFTKPEAKEWWKNEIVRFHGLVPWDGLWIDMNEPSNMVTGNVDGGCEENRWNRPPYKTHAFGHEISDRTVCGDALQHGGRHYDLHNLYGWSQVGIIFKRVYLHPSSRSQPWRASVQHSALEASFFRGRPFSGQGGGQPTGWGITGACGATCTTPS